MAAPSTVPVLTDLYEIWKHAIESSKMMQRYPLEVRLPFQPGLRGEFCIAKPQLLEGWESLGE